MHFSYASSSSRPGVKASAHTTENTWGKVDVTTQTHSESNGDFDDEPTTSRTCKCYSGIKLITCDDLIAYKGRNQNVSVSFYAF